MIHGQSLPVWATGLPKTWIARRLKYDATFNDDKLPEDFPEDADIDYIEISDVSQLRGVERFETVAFADAPSRARRKLKPGDTLLSTVRTYLKAVAFVDASVANSVASTGFAVVRPSQRFNPRFLSWVLQSDIFVNEVVSYSVGVSYPAINAMDIANLIAIQPPLHVQQAIAAHLDRETAKIDTLIAKKRDLIAKLKEQRSALISRTVTRGLPPEAAKAAGLDPNPPMKDSGVEWLGEVPEHWEAKPLKFVAFIGNGSTPARDNDGFWEDGYFPWLNSSVVNLEEVTEGVDFVTDLALRQCHLPRVSPPAVLIGITGEGRTRGMATTLKIEATINQHLAFVKPVAAKIHVDFVRRMLDCAYLHLRSESEGGGSSKGAITCEQIGNLNVLVPPLKEQFLIASYLLAETVRIERLVGLVETAITRLTEYRAALITAAVTGQVDVR